MDKPIETQISGDKLRKALLQDLVIQTIFRISSNTIFHGGTCVWRCYNGKRFSKDIDVYIPKDSSIKKIVNRLIQDGFKVKKDTEMRSSVFYTVRNSTDISLQINKSPKPPKSVVIPYILTDGTLTDIYSLSPETLIAEKITAYTDRRLERDIYDIKVLVNKVIDKEPTKERLAKFLADIKPPDDEGALKDLIYDGIIPTFKEMVEYIERWCRL